MGLLKKFKKKAKQAAKFTSKSAGSAVKYTKKQAPLAARGAKKVAKKNAKLGLQLTAAALTGGASAAATLGTSQLAGPKTQQALSLGAQMTGDQTWLPSLSPSVKLPAADSLLALVPQFQAFSPMAMPSVPQLAGSLGFSTPKAPGIPAGKFSSQQSISGLSKQPMRSTAMKTSSWKRFSWS